MKIDEIHLIISTSQPAEKLQTCDDNGDDDDDSLSVRPMKDISEEAHNCHYRDIVVAVERRVHEEEQL